MSYKHPVGFAPATNIKIVKPYSKKSDEKTEPKGDK